MFQSASGFYSQSSVRPNFSNETIDDESNQHLTLRDCRKGQRCVQVPAAVNRYLREYQREGVKFLYEHYLENTGCILGDDMGLGKTVQVISFLSAIFNKTGSQVDMEVEQSLPPVLLIVPGSVLYNWRDEFERWGYFKIGLYHGPSRQVIARSAIRKKLEVMITVYETFREDSESICKISWSCVIADEVHKIKNKDSAVHETMNKIKITRRYGLSGTLMQNELMDIYSVFSWANPGCLGSDVSFQKKYVDPITKGNITNASKRQLCNARNAQQELSNLLSRYLLRRKKSILANQLPDKEDIIIYCKTTQLQTSIINNLLCHHELTTALNRSGSPDSKAVILSFLNLYLKAANHIALLLPENTKSELQSLRSTEIIGTVFKGHDEFRKRVKESRMLTLSDVENSGKMKVLSRLLQKCGRDKSKVLLYSYSTAVLDILECYLSSSSYTFRRLDGTTNFPNRQKLCDEFNSDKNIFIFLISTKAGGVGLNLTSANKVIIFDPNWNPTHDLQAEDRAFRIGQKRDVTIFRLITEGTIEEVVYLRQIYKQQLSRTVIENERNARYFNSIKGSVDGELFGLENLFSFRNSSQISLTERILQRYKLHEDKILGKNKESLEISDDMKLFLRDITGITHVHKNSELVQESNLEVYVSDLAAHDIRNKNMCSQDLAYNCDPQQSGTSIGNQHASQNFYSTDDEEVQPNSSNKNNNGNTEQHAKHEVDPFSVLIPGSSDEDDMPHNTMSPDDEEHIFADLLHHKPSTYTRVPDNLLARYRNSSSTKDKDFRKRILFCEASISSSREKRPYRRCKRSESLKRRHHELRISQNNQQSGHLSLNRLTSIISDDHHVSTSNTNESDRECESSVSRPPATKSKAQISNQSFIDDIICGIFHEKKLNDDSPQLARSDNSKLDSADFLNSVMDQMESDKVTKSKPSPTKTVKVFHDNHDFLDDILSTCASVKEKHSVKPSTADEEILSFLDKL